MSENEMQSKINRWCLNYIKDNGLDFDPPANELDADFDILVDIVLDHHDPVLEINIWQGDTEWLVEQKPEWFVEAGLSINALMLEVFNS